MLFFRSEMSWGSGSSLVLVVAQAPVNFNLHFNMEEKLYGKGMGWWPMLDKI